MAISMLKIRRPLGRLIFNMGIAIPGKTVFLIETAPWSIQKLVLENHVSSEFAIDYWYEQRTVSSYVANICAFET